MSSSASAPPPRLTVTSCGHWSSRRPAAQASHARPHRPAPDLRSGRARGHRLCASTARPGQVPAELGYGSGWTCSLRLHESHGRVLQICSGGDCRGRISRHACSWTPVGHRATCDGLRDPRWRCCVANQRPVRRGLRNSYAPPTRGDPTGVTVSTRAQAVRVSLPNGRPRPVRLRRTSARCCGQARVPAERARHCQSVERLRPSIRTTESRAERSGAAPLRHA